MKISYDAAKRELARRNKYSKSIELIQEIELEGWLNYDITSKII